MRKYCQWVIDTGYREDHKQTGKGNAAKNLGTLSSIINNIPKLYTNEKKYRKKTQTPARSKLPRKPPLSHLIAWGNADEK